MDGSGDRATLFAHARHFDSVCADREAVIRRPGCEPRIEIAVAQLDHPMAPFADEVVMMSLAAQAVTGFAWAVHQRIHRAALAERRQRPVDSREPDAVPSGEESRVDLLCCGVVPFQGQGAEYREALLRRS
jgi:hypothetical protein